MTKRHSQFEFFSHPCFNRIFSNCLSHHSPCQRMTIKISLKRNDWVFHTGPWFWPFVSCRRIQMSGHSDLGIFNNFVSIFHFHLSISRYCVCCLSIATWQCGNDIHDLSRCHLRCWRPLFSEYCIRSRIVFYNITAENNSTLYFLVLCL